MKAEGDIVEENQGQFWNQEDLGNQNMWFARRFERKNVFLLGNPAGTTYVFIFFGMKETSESKSKGRFGSFRPCST